MLGECQSKCEHIAGVPLRPDVAENLHRIYLAKGALATTAIEGNTLSEKEVLQVLNGDLKLPPSREYLKQEIDNIVGALNGIWKQVGSGTLPALSVKELEHFNKLVLEGLSVEEGVLPGKIRTHEVGVARYRGLRHRSADTSWSGSQHGLKARSLRHPKGWRSSGVLFGRWLLTCTWRGFTPSVTGMGERLGS